MSEWLKEHAWKVIRPRVLTNTATHHLNRFAAFLAEEHSPKLAEVRCVHDLLRDDRDVRPVNPHDPATRPANTIVVRCGGAQGIQELADRLSRDGS